MEDDWVDMIRIVACDQMIRNLSNLLVTKVKSNQIIHSKTFKYYWSFLMSPIESIIRCTMTRMIHQNLLSMSTVISTRFESDRNRQQLRCSNDRCTCRVLSDHDENQHPLKAGSFTIAR